MVNTQILVRTALSGFLPLGDRDAMARMRKYRPFADALVNWLSISTEN
jgi:hypothetical protein